MTTYDGFIDRIVALAHEIEDAGHDGLAAALTTVARAAFLPAEVKRDLVWAGQAIVSAAEKASFRR